MSDVGYNWLCNAIYITRTDTWHGMLSGKLRKNCLSQKLVIPFHVTMYHEIETMSMETNGPLLQDAWYNDGPAQPRK